MITFPEDILLGVCKMRKMYVGRKHSVAANFPVIEIIRYMQDREISTKLFYFIDKGTMEIQAPDQRFYSKISHYDYRSAERRWVRNKEYLFSLIKDLKKSGLWEYVLNKDFFIVNSFNKKTDPEALLKILNDIVK